MYARMLQFTAKPDQGSNLTQTMRERTLPLLKQQPGFIDALGLNSDTEPNQFVGITIWKSKEDAEKFVTGPGQQLLQSIRAMVLGEPIVRTFNVQVSATHDVSIGRTASSS